MPDLKKRKAFRSIAIFGLVAIGLLSVTPVGQLLLAILAIRFEEFKLFHLTDREQLLAASRIVVTDAKHYRQNPYVHGGSDEDGYSPDPSDPRMPVAIRSLGCSYIVVRKNTLRAEMGGGFYHYGFMAFFPREGDSPDKNESPKGLHFYSDTE